jgi:hypothetical protein
MKLSVPALCAKRLAMNHLISDWSCICKGATMLHERNTPLPVTVPKTSYVGQESATIPLWSCAPFKSWGESRTGAVHLLQPSGVSSAWSGLAFPTFRQEGFY